jgi:hypothetical protein
MSSEDLGSAVPKVEQRDDCALHQFFEHTNLKGPVTSVILRMRAFPQATGLAICANCLDHLSRMVMAREVQGRILFFKTEAPKQ